LTGAPFKIIFNHRDKLHEAVSELVEIMSGKSEKK
jgi:adenylate kinase